MKYYVRLCRPRFEIAAVELEAKDHDDAEAKAIELAEFSDLQWDLLPFHGENYIAHAPLHLSEEEVEDAAGNPVRKRVRQTAQQQLARYSKKYDRYLLLHADINAGEGTVVFQPWFTESEVDLLHDDLVSDWIFELGQYVSPPEPDQPRAKVIKFRRSKD